MIAKQQARAHQPAETIGPHATTGELVDWLTPLSGTVVEHARLRKQAWRPLIQRAAFLHSARNMARWLALRQNALSGGAAPGRSAGRMQEAPRTSVTAILAALAQIAGLGPAPAAPPAEGEPAMPLLDSRRNVLFGAQDPEGPRTRVMVTLPPEAGRDGGTLMTGLVAAGMDCVRINCAHDRPEVWSSMVDALKSLDMGRAIPVSMDLGGPKFCVRATAAGKKAGGVQRLFRPGDRFALVQDPDQGPKGMFSVALSHPALVEALQPGSVLTIGHGKIWASVDSLEEGCALMQVTRAPEKGGKIKPGKGVTLPGVNLPVRALTPDDLRLLDFVLLHADVVIFSFVETVADVEALITAMEARRKPGRALPGIVLKIETPQALHNLPDLIVAAGGRVPVAVMIARDDLAAEIGVERLCEIQDEVLWLCEAGQVPVVWSSHVLEGMVRDGKASRAEVADAALSHRAECVLLNEGPHLTDAVGFLRDVLLQMSHHAPKKPPKLGPLTLWRAV